MTLEMRMGARMEKWMARISAFTAGLCENWDGTGGRTWMPEDSSDFDALNEAYDLGMNWADALRGRRDLQHRLF